MSEINEGENLPHHEFLHALLANILFGLWIARNDKFSYTKELVLLGFGGKQHGLFLENYILVCDLFISSLIILY